MAKGKNAEDKGHPGLEFWSRRPYSGLGTGKWLKKMCHRVERRLAKIDLKKEVEKFITGSQKGQWQLHAALRTWD